jgi:pyruvate formate lyase activating enzyme
MIASFYEPLENKAVKCLVCPHVCIIPEGKTGTCKVRKNFNGKLHACTYRKYAAVSFDPIEKKPLYHFYPGKEILSVGSVGCNLFCKWCQNCEISQSGINDSINLTEFKPEDLLRIANDRPGNIGIAFTYNEPLINIESNIETAKLFKDNNLQTVMVSNGYFSDSVLSEYLNVIDAFNIDIKAFDNHTYKQFTNASLLPVLENVKAIKSAGKHLELTFLVVPEVNDNTKLFSDFCKWIAKHISEDSILHISRYFPRHKMHLEPTQEKVMIEFVDIAEEYLNYVYAGNILLRNFNHTKCPDCKDVIINRHGYMIQINNLAKNGFCPECNKKIFIS